MKIDTGKRYNIWWGPPRKFSTRFEERKISWLELFYDLVYVTVISQATHHLAANPGTDGIVDYCILFVMIFWGWLNGSMYHDLHGTQGIRTRFMTLWQMMAVASLAVTLNGPHAVFTSRTIYALIFLQFYITYLWWSVGIYDKDHRKLNRPYTACYLVSLALIVGTLYVPQPFKRAFLGGALILNYLPPFISAALLKRRGLSLNLSSSMVERLGLFTIIVFGEAILGVITGASGTGALGMEAWACFGMGILIVFALWWIFFSLIADREIQKKYLKWQTMSMLYIPTLASLGIVGASFPGLMGTMEGLPGPEYAFLMRTLFGVSLSVFLVSIWAISRHLNYPKEYDGSKKTLRPIIILAACGITLLTLLAEDITLICYLLLVFCILFFIIVTLTRMWFRIELRHQDGVPKAAHESH